MSLPSGIFERNEKQYNVSIWKEQCGLLPYVSLKGVDVTR